MKRIVCLTLCAGLALPLSASEPTSVAEKLALGDAHYAERARGAEGAHAQSAEIDAAIAAYRAAALQAPESDEAVFKLLRALHFRAWFCGATRSEQRALYDEAIHVAQEAVDLRQGRPPAPEQRSVRAELYHWAGVSWGQWSLFASKLESMRRGVAGRVRDLAQASIDLDPEVEDGGGYRLLGRLHDQAPRVLFITPWVSKEKGVAHLRRSFEIAPDNVVTWYFLGQALLKGTARDREEGRALLTRLAAHEPQPPYVVEEAHYRNRGRDALAALKN
jgi:tetratricopeptide (TPR) repeat protein